MLPILLPEGVSAGASDRGVVSAGGQDGIGTPGGGTPLEVWMVLDKTVCDQQLVLLFHFSITQ